MRGSDALGKVWVSPSLARLRSLAPLLLPSCNETPRRIRVLIDHPDDLILRGIEWKATFNDILSPVNLSHSSNSPSLSCQKRRSHRPVLVNCEDIVMIETTGDRLLRRRAVRAALFDLTEDQLPLSLGPLVSGDLRGHEEARGMIRPRSDDTILSPLISVKRRSIRTVREVSTTNGVRDTALCSNVSFL